MGDVRLYAVGIDELRDLFSGSDASGERMRALAFGAFPPPAGEPPRRPNLLDKLGPLVRRPPNAVAPRPGVPTGADLNDLIAGRYIAPERLDAAWALVQLWLEDAAWGTLKLGVTEPQMNDLDFELSSGGVSTALAFRRLFNDRLALPVHSAPGEATGYSRGRHAVELRDAWRGALEWLSPQHAEVARAVVTWLDAWEDWSAKAAASGRPEPDLVARFSCR